MVNFFWTFHIEMPFIPEALGMLCVSSWLCSHWPEALEAQPERPRCAEAWGRSGVCDVVVCRRTCKGCKAPGLLDPSHQAKQRFSSLKVRGRDRQGGWGRLAAQEGGSSSFSPRQESLLCLMLFLSITVSHLTPQRSGMGKQVAGTQDCFPAPSNLLL